MRRARDSALPGSGSSGSSGSAAPGPDKAASASRKKAKRASASEPEPASASSDATAAEWELRHEEGKRRFVFSRPRTGPIKDDDDVAFIEYAPTRTVGTLDLFETFVPVAERGKGVALALSKAVFEHLRGSGQRIVASCTYLANHFLARHPSFLPLVVGTSTSDPEPRAAHGDAAPTRAPASAPASAQDRVTFGMSLGRPVTGRIHLMPFLLPTRFCDSQHPSVEALARQLLPEGTPAREAAARVRNWVRHHIVYVLDDKDHRASHTLDTRQGMCTNKANLQVALMRAAGLPAGYVMCHLAKEAFQSDSMLAELYGKISDPTIHCFAAVYDAAAGDFLHFDATEKLKGPPHKNELLDEDPATGESRYKQSFLRGPMTPVQSNLDHLLAWEFPTKIDPALRKRQNESYRAHGGV